MRTTLLAAAAAAFLALDGHAQSVAHLRGHVRDFDSEGSISAVEVGLIDDRGRRLAASLSDSAGAFAFRDVRPGSYRLRARALGYQSVTTPPLSFSGDRDVDVIVRLSAQAVPLAPLEVVTRRTAGSATHPGLAAFFERHRQDLGGVFIMREELELRSPRQVSDLIATIGGFTVVGNGISNNRTQCAPVVYLDGQRIVSANNIGRGIRPDDAFEAVNFVHWRELEGVEIYKGAATIPNEFRDSHAACGVIALWSRRG